MRESLEKKQLEKAFSPIIKSQQNVSDKIVHTLREGRESNVPIKLEARKKRKLEKDDIGEIANRYRNRYMSPDPSFDVSFGINFLTAISIHYPMPSSAI